MDLVEVIKRARALLQSEGRLSYRLLQKQFGLDEDGLDDLKYELIDIQEVAADKDDKMLVWTGGGDLRGDNSSADSCSSPNPPNPNKKRPPANAVN